MLHNVIVVSQLDSPLLSCSKLFDSRLTPGFFKTGATILTNGKILQTGPINSKKYLIAAILDTKHELFTALKQPTLNLGTND
jgi:hypothetical protein